LQRLQLLDGSNLPMIPKDFLVLNTANNRMRDTRVATSFHSTPQKPETPVKAAESVS
jgi:hypothetical protein